MVALVPEEGQSESRLLLSCIGLVVLGQKVLAGSYVRKMQIRYAYLICLRLV